MFVGGHLDIVDGSLLSTVQAAHEAKMTCVQVFAANPRSGRMKQRKSAELTAVRTFLSKHRMKLFFHMPYIYNLARPLTAARLAAIVAEIETGLAAGYSGSVVHVGKAVRELGAAAAQNFEDNLRAITNELPLILETPAGQGSEMCVKLEELAALYERLGRPRNLSFCVDTCHVFAAGYMRTAPDVQSYFQQFDQLIGLHQLALIHMNDSKLPFNSRKDRHECIGRGEIPNTVLRAVLRFALDHHIPLCVETQQPAEDTATLLQWAT